MIRFDAVIIGAGVVGLAVARAMAISGRSVLILEREAKFGTGTSSRNSEVIHAGIYYEPGSLKERLCIAGRELLYEFCQQRGVPHRRCGKLIIANRPDERCGLEAIYSRGISAGVCDLVWLDRRAASALEPALLCEHAVHSPSTGIIDAHYLMLALLQEAEDHDALLVCRSPAERIERVRNMWLVHAGAATVETGIVVNAAGLDAQSVAGRIDALAPEHIPPLYLAKGTYFTYSGRVPFSRLIYPVPVPGGLGTHLTLDLTGQARFGPDVEWLVTIEYDVDPTLKPDFVSAARRIWPGLDSEKIQPGYAGIRPKLSRSGEVASDFVIQGQSIHGMSGLVNLFGIESPGLTASIAIADQVRGFLD